MSATHCVELCGGPCDGETRMIDPTKGLKHIAVPFRDSVSGAPHFAIYTPDEWSADGWGRATRLLYAREELAPTPEAPDGE